MFHKATRESVTGTNPFPRLQTLRAFRALPVLFWVAGIVLTGTDTATAETVDFQSAPRALNLGQAGKSEGDPQTDSQHLTAELTKPSGVGPFPAVVLLHGCAGIKLWNERWTRRLVDWGYVVLDVDSLTPRGRTNVCRRVFDVSPAQRALDAFGAKAFLERLAFVDHAKIAVFGMSHGGWAALIAARRRTAANLNAAPFSAAVTLYPWCETGHDIATPLLILIGEKDDWTPARLCEEQVAHLDQDGLDRGPEVRLKVYPESHHGFDFEGLDEAQDGHTIRYDPAAARDAIATVRAFLATHLSHGSQ